MSYFSKRRLPNYFLLQDYTLSNERHLHPEDLQHQVWMISQPSSQPSRNSGSVARNAEMSLRQSHIFSGRGRYTWDSRSRSRDRSRRDNRSKDHYSK